MVILLCYTSTFSEVIYADFYAKILDWNFRLFDKNSRILVVVFDSKLNFSFSFRFVDENYIIFVIVVIFMTKINLLSSTKIFVFVVVDEKNTDRDAIWTVGSDSPTESSVRWGPDPPREGGILGEMVPYFVKYTDFLPSAVQKSLN